MEELGTGSEVSGEPDIHYIMDLMIRLLWKKHVPFILALENFLSYWLQRQLREIGNFSIVGSVGEGLGGLSILMQTESDVDVMGNILGAVVIERHVGNYSNVKVLRLENSKRHPGYALLRLLGSDTYTTNYFSSQRIRNIEKQCIRDADLGGLLSSFGGIPCLLHGPAFMFSIFQKSPVGLTALDLVISIRCDEWPSVADEWIERKRSGWPSETLIAEAVEMGCDLVPIGPAGDSMEDNEWRISLVRAERHLIHTLNSAQLRKFALLKIILKHGVFGEIFYNKISTYVAKTAFFWISEDYNGDQWEDRYCIYYLRLCLLKLIHFITNCFCPHYFIRDCNVLREKLNDQEKQSFIHTHDNFITTGCLKDKIISLVISTGAQPGWLSFLNIFRKNIQMMSFVESVSDRFLEEHLLKVVRRYLLTHTTQDLMSSINELGFLLRSFRNSSLTSNIFMYNIALEDFFIRYLTCAKLRVVNTAIPRNELSKNERFDILRKLLSRANLITETLCAAEITQISHVFFTNALYENALHLIVPMLEEFKKVPCIRLQGIDSLFKTICSAFVNMNNVSFASPRSPVCDITFFSLEESILTKHLRIEIVSAELGYKKSVESGHFGGLDFPRHVNVHPLVYAYYMKYKCCRYLGRVIDSCRALQELEDQELEVTEPNYYNLNLLGCSLYESRNFEKAMEVFVLSNKKRVYRLSVFYHVGILLRRCFKDSYKTV